MKLPKSVVVGKTLSSRYSDGLRPMNWDLRCSVVEEVESVEGERFVLASEGGQSTPQPGWKIMLIHEHSEGAYYWTLQGFCSTVVKENVNHQSNG